MLDATERRVLVACACVAGGILLLPGERVAAGAAFVLAALLGGWHVRQSKRDAAARPAPGAPPG